MDITKFKKYKPRTYRVIFISRASNAKKNHLKNIGMKKKIKCRNKIKINIQELNCKLCDKGILGNLGGPWRNGSLMEDRERAIIVK